MKLSSLIPTPKGRHIFLRFPLKKDKIKGIRTYPNHGIVSFEYNKTIRFPFYSHENLFVLDNRTGELHAIFYLNDCCCNNPSIIRLCTDEMLECKVLLNKKERRTLQSALEET